MTALELFAKNILPEIKKFYEDPKNQAEFEAWKAKRDAEKGERKCVKKKD